MHVALGWSIPVPPDGARWQQINDQLKAVIQNYSWVRPLPTFYVIKVASLEDRDAVVNGLIAVIKTLSEQVHFIASPPMVGGSYAGWLPSNLWTEINQRTT